MRVLVVVPTYNERENVPLLLPAVRSSVPAADVLVVDDHSPDGTGDIVDRAGRTSLGTSPCCAGLEAGPGQRLPGRIRVRPRSRLRRRRVDGRRPLSRSRGASRVASIDRGRRRRGHRVALRPGWEDRRLAVASPSAVAFGEPLHVVGARGCRFATAHRATGPIGPRPSRRSTRARRVLRATPSSPSSSCRLVRAGLRVMETPIVFCDRRYGTSKMSGRIVAESMWLVTSWALRDALRRLAPYGTKASRQCPWCRLDQIRHVSASVVGTSQRTSAAGRRASSEPRRPPPTRRHAN